MTTAAMRMERLVRPAEDLEAAVREPGPAFDGRIFVNFGGPLATDFLLRIGPRLSADAKGLPFFEVHQPHPRGVEWATLEFPLAPIAGPVEIAFQGRLLPQSPVHVKLYGENLEHEVARLPMNHIIKRYRVPIDEEGVAAVAGKDFRLGFCLPGRTWFLFQISALAIRPIDGVGAP